MLPRVAASLISGLAAAVEAYTFGHISGSHVNPFVTLSFAIFLDFQWERVCVQSTIFLFYEVKIL